MIKKIMLFINGCLDKIIYKLFSKDMKKYYAFEQEFFENSKYNINLLYDEYVGAINNTEKLLGFRNKLSEWAKSNKDADLEYILNMCILSKHHIEGLTSNIFNPYTIAIIVLILDKIFDAYVNTAGGILFIFIIIVMLFIKTLLYMKNEFYQDALKKDFYELLYKAITNQEP